VQAQLDSRRNVWRIKIERIQADFRRKSTFTSLWRSEIFLDFILTL
jgi:hypothetical protein